jgi:serine/threonine protein kinase
VDLIWPQTHDYDDAMKTLSQRVLDKELQDGKLIYDQATIMRFGGANNYITLYKIDDWMVRCFCQDKARGKRPPDDIKLRYQHISTFVQQHASETSALVYLKYVPDAIEVDFTDRQNQNSFILIKTKVLPFVRMKFIDGLSLGTFIAKYYENSIKMQELCDAWLRMIRELETLQMAHGDLDLTNVFVTEKNGTIILKLIDYDNAWVPAFTGLQLTQTEVGHEHFQHPAFASRTTRAFDQYMDHFAALTIYISLKALTFRPGLYKDAQWGSSDAHLLLTKTDYEAESKSLLNKISLLQNLHTPGLDPLLRELRACLKESRQPASLSELLALDSEPSLPLTWEDVLVFPQKSTLSDEQEFIYYDKTKITYFKQPDEILVPAASLEPNTSAPQQMLWEEPLPIFQPSQNRPVEPFFHQPVYVPPSLKHFRMEKSKRNYLSRRSIIWLVAILMLILLIIIGILLLNSAHASSSFSPFLPLYYAQHMPIYAQTGYTKG